MAFLMPQRQVRNDGSAQPSDATPAFPPQAHQPAPVQNLREGVYRLHKLQMRV
ncbi:hypothetical protein [Vandammella animalimorsus]|uniref:hypothetical protein n=1 Tax=Vandammella animalimorsus TaxID=2029117 RepID=UPI001555FB87|nr:hypothetical protein [Vandammella animalimorsus]